MKLSLIIPIYNVEQYIERCLKSCLCQSNVTTDDYELVLVNDGTKDNSMQVVEKMTRNRSNVTIVNQHNQGLSMARNVGLKAAQGEYVNLGVISIRSVTENRMDEITQGEDQTRKL